MALTVASRYLEESVGSKGLPKSGTRCLFTGGWTCGSVSRLNRGVNQSTQTYRIIWRLSGCQSDFFNIKSHDYNGRETNRAHTTL